MSGLRERLGSVLQQQRQRRGYTQSELAEKANLSLKYLGEVERGEANVTVDALERITSALGWDPWELFSDDPTPISQGVHQLLIVELSDARLRLQTVLDWLLALDPVRRSKMPQTLHPNAPPGEETKPPRGLSEHPTSESERKGKGSRVIETRT